MARARRRTHRTVVDRDPNKKGVQHRPPKGTRVRVVDRKATPSRAGALALNPDQMLEYGDRNAAFTSEMGDLGQNLDTAKSQLPDILQDINRNMTGVKEDAASGLSSRGIFESSIRDIQLADINAQQALQEKSANDVVNAAQTAYTTRQQQIEGAGGERQRVETFKQNAMGANSLANTTPGTPEQAHSAVDRNPNKPGVQNKPPHPVRVTVQVGGNQQQGGGRRPGRARAHPRNPHGDPFARR